MKSHIDAGEHGCLFVAAHSKDMTANSGLLGEHGNNHRQNQPINDDNGDDTEYFDIGDNEVLVHIASYLDTTTSEEILCQRSEDTHGSQGNDKGRHITVCTDGTAHSTGQDAKQNGSHHRNKSRAGSIKDGYGNQTGKCDLRTDGQVDTTGNDDQCHTQSNNTNNGIVQENIDDIFIV